MIMPLTFWEEILRFFLGKGYELKPFYDYAFRCTIFGYVILGIFFLIMATDPQRYKPLILMAQLSFFVNAAVCFFIGISSGMSALLYLFDTVLFLIFGFVLLYLWRLKNLE